MIPLGLFKADRSNKLLNILLKITLFKITIIKIAALFLLVSLILIYVDSVCNKFFLSCNMYI